MVVVVVPCHIQVAVAQHPPQFCGPANVYSNFSAIAATQPPLALLAEILLLETVWNLGVIYMSGIGGRNDFGQVPNLDSLRLHIFLPPPGRLPLASSARLDNQPVVRRAM